MNIATILGYLILIIPYIIMTVLILRKKYVVFKKKEGLKFCCSEHNIYPQYKKLETMSVQPEKLRHGRPVSVVPVKILKAPVRDNNGPLSGFLSENN